MNRTPLFEQHHALSGKLIDFGGWELPVQYSGIIEEHERVRQAAGLFDVSHMGEIVVKGDAALDFLQKMVTGDVTRLNDNQVLYTLMCYEDGGVVDDLLVYRYNQNYFLLVVNACNTDKDFTWIKDHAPPGIEVENLSTAYAQLALQGPQAEEVLHKLTTYPLRDIPFFHFVPQISLAGHTALVSRTGYTGEDGFEIYLSPQSAPAVWQAILDAGAPHGVLPIGLGARDTLRFEANLPLYGHELSPNITPLEAGLGFFVKLKKGSFIGREALQAQKEHGIPRELIGFTMVDRGIPRGGYHITTGEEIVGQVTSGSFSPTLKQNIGLALVKRGEFSLGEELHVSVRGRPLLAKRVALPFYDKKYKR